MTLQRMLSREVLRVAGRWAWSRLQGAGGNAAGAGSQAPSRLADRLDQDLVRTVSEAGDEVGATQLEMLRRLRESLDRATVATAALGGRVERLTRRLLWLAAVIAALTIAQVVLGFKLLG